MPDPTPQPEKNLPANVPPQPGGIIKITDAHQVTDLASDDYTGPPLIGNLDMQSPAGRALFMKKASLADHDAGQMAGQVFKLTHFIAERTMVRSQKTEELVCVPRVILFNEKGETLITAAWSVAHFLQTFIQVFGPGPWNPPVPILISPARDRRGNAVYKVEIAE